MSYSVNYRGRMYVETIEDAIIQDVLKVFDGEVVTRAKDTTIYLSGHMRDYEDEKMRELFKFLGNNLSDLDVYFKGEDDEYWRLVLEDGVVMNHPGHIVYDDDGWEF